jgi:hypothetical protein
VRTKSVGVWASVWDTGFRHIPLSAGQLAGRAQIRDVQLLSKVVRVGDQVIAIIATAIAVLVCARLARSLFLLELSAFCTRDFRFPWHGKRAFLLLFLLFLFLFFFLFVIVVVVVVGIITLTGEKIIRSGWQKVLQQRILRTVSPHSLQCHSHR